MATVNINIHVRKEGDFNLKEKVAKLELATLIGVRQLIEDVHRVSRPITPMLTGDLREDVKKMTAKSGNTVRGSIEWHRPYSWYQERGYTSGPVKNYTTAGTHAHFAEESVKEVTKTPKKYFGKKI